MPESGTPPSLIPSNGEYARFDEILREAAKRPMTLQERREQEVSFVYGMGGRQCGLTREQVAELLKEHYE